MQQLSKLREAIDSYNDFPKPGILFRDIRPILRQYELRQALFDIWCDKLSQLQSKINVVVGIEARGFALAMALANRFQCGFAMIRKQGKLPNTDSIVSQTYSKEYGADSLELDLQDIASGSQVLIVDDLLATGGTMRAAIDLVKKQSDVSIVACSAVIELKECDGRCQLPSDVNFISIFEL